MDNRTIIDQKALANQRARALRLAKDDADFLLAYVADDIDLRLSTIKRIFQSAVDLNSATSAITKMLGRRENVTDITTTSAPVFAEHRESGLIRADETLDLQPQSADLIISALNLQFVNDLPGVLIQIRRSLKPDGLFLGAFIGGSSLKELRQCFLEAEAELTAAASAHILPFVDVRDGGALLQRAGFALPVSDTDILTVRYDNMFALMHDLRAMGATNCLTGRARHFMRRDVLFKAAEIYATKHADPDGRIRATFEIISVSGWAPHESQQKPLKPGSAQVNLKDVLGKRSQPGD